MLARGDEIAGYRIDDVLGHGGMGVVYRATQLSLDRAVALKVLAPHLSNDAGFRERFREEGRVQARLDHPNVITIHEAGESEAGLFIAMRLVNGKDLKELILSAELPPRRALAILGQAGAALDAAHDLNLVHRDIKPQNVLVGPSDHAYLADFGLTKPLGQRGVTQTGQFLGTLDYISPEQIQGNAATAASDIYSFGAVVYEALTGVVPFPRDTDAAVLWAHVTAEVPPASVANPELPKALDGVLENAMAKNPADRPSSAEAIVREITEVAEGGLPRNPPRPKLTPDLEVPTPAVAAPPPVVRETIIDGREGRVHHQAEPHTLRSGRRRRILAAAAPLILAVIVTVGYASGRRAANHAHTGAISVRVSSITLLVPQPWKRTAPSRAAKLSLRYAAGFSNGSASLLVGWHGRAAASPTPPAVAARAMGVDLRRPITAKLGAGYALLYRSRTRTRSLSAFFLPTTVGVVTFVCQAARTGALAGFEGIVATARLTRGRVLPIGPDARYASGVHLLLRDLTHHRDQAVVAMNKATTRNAEARWASQVASYFEVAEASFTRLSSSDPRLQRVNSQLVRNLNRAKTAWLALASTAKHGPQLDYSRAAARVRNAEHGLAAPLASLRALGYAVGS